MRGSLTAIRWWRSGVGSRESGVRSRESGVMSRESGVMSGSITFVQISFSPAFLFAEVALPKRKQMVIVS